MSEPNEFFLILKLVAQVCPIIHQHRLFYVLLHTVPDIVRRGTVNRLIAEIKQMVERETKDAVVVNHIQMI